MSARRSLIALLMLAVAGCAGDGVILPPPEPPPPSGPTLSFLQSTIFTPQCSFPGCHGAPAQQGMDLTDGHTYVNTVGVDAVELQGFKRVDPGHAEDSYLYMKIAGDPRITGDRMPQGGVLTADEIDAVRAWIDAGAADN
jgi:hypothetical protein